MIFSQNFIKFSNLVKQLLAVSSIKSTDLVIEIGPGKGIITKELLIKSSEVIAVEKDRNLLFSLQNKFKSHKNLKLINQDILLYKFPQTTFKIFSNIPFSITAKIIDKILKSPYKPTEIYFIMQLEAANKYLITNNFNNQDAILLAPFYDVQILGDIDRTAFTPKPQVDIVFTKFTLKNKFLINFADYQLFSNFVIYGFNQWKPNIFQAYKKIFSYEQFKKINKQLKINNLKPSQLNISQWIELFKIFFQYVTSDKQRLISSFKRF